MSNPSNTDKCSTCQHAYSGHYITFDGLHCGCTHSSFERNENSYCNCKGFSIIFKPALTNPSPHPVFRGDR